MTKSDRNIAGIILAAGEGTRMGRTKQLLPVNGVPLLQEVVNQALESRLHQIVVVLGHDADTIRKNVDLSRVTVVENREYRKGQSSSLKRGLDALPAGVDAALFLLVDQPLVDAEIINSLIDGYNAYPDPILLPVHDGRTGNPVLMDRRVFPALLETAGDVGGRSVFSRFRNQIREIPVRHGGIHIDLDTDEEYRSFLEHGSCAVSSSSLLETLQPQPGSVISLVGAGGKTTTAFSLAREMRDKGGRILVTTTTAMYHPDRDLWPCDQLWLKTDPTGLAPPDRESGSITVAAGRYEQETGKIRGYRPDLIDGIAKAGGFDHILVEADGSRGRPLKAPAAHEPVVPRSTRYLLGVAGLFALGKPLCEEWVHRSSLFSELTGLALGKPVTASEIKALLVSPRGLFKSCPAAAERIVILTAARNDPQFQAGRCLCQAVTAADHQQHRIARALVCCADSQHRIRVSFRSLASRS